jgi:hypothetical protein
MFGGALGLFAQCLFPFHPISIYSSPLPLVVRPGPLVFRGHKMPHVCVLFAERKAPRAGGSRGRLLLAGGSCPNGKFAGTASPPRLAEAVTRGRNRELSRRASSRAQPAQSLVRAGKEIASACAAASAAAQALAAASAAFRCDRDLSGRDHRGAAAQSSVIATSLAALTEQSGRVSRPESCVKRSCE